VNVSGRNDALARRAGDLARAAEESRSHSVVAVPVNPYPPGSAHGQRQAAIIVPVERYFADEVNPTDEELRSWAYSDAQESYEDFDIGPAWRGPGWAVLLASWGRPARLHQVLVRGRRVPAAPHIVSQVSGCLRSRRRGSQTPQ
jgi:hypothetical protein